MIKKIKKKIAESRPINKIRFIYLNDKLKKTKKKKLEKISNFKSCNGSPYDLKHSNAVLRKNFNLEIVLDKKKKNMNLYNFKYHVKNLDLKKRIIKDKSIPKNKKKNN